MPPINLRMSDCDRVEERDRGRQKGKRSRGGAKERGIRESCLFCKADRKLSKTLSWDHVE